VIALELTKQLRRPRSMITLAVLALLAAVITLVLGVSHPSLAERVGDWGSVVSNTTGLTMPLITLSAMILFLLPLAVAIFAGETVAGEASWGSLRYILARPVPRWRVLGAKAATAAGFSLLAVVIVVLISLGTGVAAFGWHPLTLTDLQHTSPFIFASATFSPFAGLARIGLASAFILGTLASTFSFAFLLSTVTTSPFTAVAGGVGLGLVSRALDNVPGLHALSPWLPVSDSGTALWTGFFTRPMQTAGMAHVLEVQAGYAAAFLTAALIWFQRSDVLS
jgi:ABC-2 type transport system permease protein